METFDEKPMVDLKRGIGDTKFARKKQKLEKGEDIKTEECELELDEKVAAGCKTEPEPSENVLSNLKVEKVSPTLPLHTGARWSLLSDFRPTSQFGVFIRIPTVQFGTYKLKGVESFEATLSALQQGYKGIDTATCYDNEKQVSNCISKLVLKLTINLAEPLCQSSLLRMMELLLDQGWGSYCCKRSEERGLVCANQAVAELLWDRPKNQEAKVQKLNVKNLGTYIPKQTP